MTVECPICGGDYVLCRHIYIPSKEDQVVDANKEIDALRTRIAELEGVRDREITPEGYEFVSTKPEMSKLITTLRARVAELEGALNKIVSLEWTAADGGEPASIARAALNTEGKP